MPPSSVNFRMWFDPLSSPRSYSTTISSTTRCLVLPESIFDNMINWLPIECSRQNVSDYCYMNHVHARSMSFCDRTGTLPFLCPPLPFNSLWTDLSSISHFNTCYLKRMDSQSMALSTLSLNRLCLSKQRLKRVCLPTY